MSDQPPQTDFAAPSDAAAYLAELSSDMAQIARRHGLDALAFIFDMARLEAEAASRSRKGRPPELADRL